uniref:cytochrome c biogenesis CcdA family protein n=1 Tax=Cohnella rhizosphaerae TaxID=1457232 RepID=UPI003B8A6510
MFAGYVQRGAADNKRRALLIAINFILGMVVTSLAVGLIVALLGQQFLPFVEKYRLLTWVPPIFDILAGLQLLGVISFAMPTFQKSLNRPEHPPGAAAAFKLGIPYGLVISPCAIPIFFCADRLHRPPGKSAARRAAHDGLFAGERRDSRGGCGFLHLHSAQIGKMGRSHQKKWPAMSPSRLASFSSRLDL